MKYTLLLTLIVTFSLFAGCSATPNRRHPDIPAWYLHPPKDSPRYLYGVGSGEDRKSAIDSALADMISKLGISIQSTMRTKEESYGRYYANSISTSDIKTDIAKIKIDNYEIIDTRRISYDKYAVLLRTDKQKFAKRLQLEVESKLSTLENLSYTAMRNDPLSRYNTLKHIAKKADKLLSSIYILSQMDKKVDEKSYLTRVEKLQHLFDKEKSKMTFSLQRANKGAEEFAKYIAAYLTGNGLRIAESNETLKIAIETSMDQASSPIGKIDIVTLEIKIYEKNTLVGGSSRVYKVRHNDVKTYSYKRAAKEFAEELKNKGVKILGINLEI